MNQEILNILLSGLSVIITGLCSWIAATLVKWLNEKISDKKYSDMLSQLIYIITDAVQCVYQEFVEVLKKEGGFTEEAQKEAKERAMNIIYSQLSEKMKQFIIDNYGNIETWLSEKIESVIYSLKAIQSGK